MKKHYYIMSHQHSCSVVVSFRVEEDTKQGSNPGRSKKKKKSPSLATQGVVVVTQWVVVGTARPYRVKEWFEGFIGRFG